MSAVAIVGIGCRFPGGVHDATSFWEFLLNKGDGIVEMPSNRWSVDKYYDPDPDAPGRMYTRRGGFLTDSLWDFDPEFFGISPREASIMDPQQRLLLEVSWEALDDAGLAGAVAGRAVGVYVGAFTSDHAMSQVARPARPFISGHTPTSYSFTLLSNRISYALNLQGPSMTIDTACSSSLVAFHQGTRAIVGGECDLALVGGVNAMLQPETFISMCKGRFLSVDGRSKAFDASADGYGRGEGAGIVVLKRLDAARRDGDRIYAVVSGTGSNQDGRTIALPVPNAAAQEALARRVHEDAGIAPHEIAYVEAHGTGTSVGDPLEMSALGKVYGAVDGRTEPLPVGSVKASIGHLEAAAGIASVIKSALTVHHRTIVPQAWLETLNPEIPFDDLNLRVATEVQPIPDRYEKARVAVNSFGYGGTNAHVILQEAPESMRRERREPVFPVLPVSGRNEAAVRALAGRFAELVDGGADLDALVAASWTRRAHHPFRAAFDFSDADDLLTKLQSFASGEGRSPTRAIAGDAARPVFVFSGMGPQWWGMGRELLQSDGAFAHTARAIDEEFTSIAGWSIIEELLRPEEESRVTSTEFAQPANFLVQVALVAELATLGVHPAAVVGHSVGEVSAAYVSGALGLHDALRVSYHRARLQATTRGTGGMLAVGLSETDASAAIPVGEPISVAAVNSPAAVTLAGDDEAIARLQESLTEAGTFARTLQVEVAYHSHLMDPILDEVRSVLADLEPRTPSLPLYSTVLGGRVCGPDWDADYWCRNVREPVRFADTLTNIVADDHRVFLEVGPNPVLSGNIREILIRAGETGTSIGTLVRKEGDHVSLRRAFAELYAAGGVDGSSVPGLSSMTPHVELPAYPWQKTRVWTEVDAVVRDRLGTDGGYPMLGERTESSASEWTVELSPTGLPWLADHVVEDLVVLPGTAYLDAALSAAATRTGREDLALEDIRFIAPLVIESPDVPVLRLTVEESTKRFTVASRPATGSTWTVNASGRLVEGRVRPTPIELPPDDDSFTVRGDDMYAALAARGLKYGPAFQGIVDARVGADSVIARIDTSVARNSAHVAHPAVVDTALQCVAALAAGSDATADGALVPAAVRAVRRFGPIPESATVRVRRVGSEPLRADIDIVDDEGRQVLAMAGVEFRPVTPAGSVHARLERVFYEPRWELWDGTSPTMAEAVPAQEFALIVALGEVPSPRVTALADRCANSASYRITDPLLPQLEDDIAAALRAGLATEGVERANVIVLAGSGLPANVNVHAVARVASTAAAVLDDYTAGDHATPERSKVEIGAVIVTEHGFCLPGDTVDADLSHTALVGARRALFNEQSRLRWRLVDTEPETSAEELAAEVLVGGARAGEEVDEVSLRMGSRWVLRVRKNLREHLESWDELRTLDDPEASFALEVPHTRLLQDLGWREVDRVAPQEGQIEIRMGAIGLNYKDPLKVLGLLTEKELEGTFFGTGIGLEGSGMVTRVGPGVSGIAVGDRVGVSAPSMARRYLTIDQNLATVGPAHWDAGVCSSTTPFLTAEFALIELARIRAGDTVLIHGGAGGVGLAAIQVARNHGARVIATASTEERREYALAAGADEAIDSRSMNFVDEVMRLTDGHGADIVLNSAPGEIIQQNLRVAAEFGRIVEIGKIDIYGGSVIDLRPFDRNLTFIALDLDRMTRLRYDDVHARMDGIVDKFKAGVYRHLAYRTYPMSEVVAAFDAVVRPTQIGRIVVSLEDPVPQVRPLIPTAGIRSDAAYLVTGGFGAFGLATARWLVREGARHLILIGRSGPTTEQAEKQMAAFADAGVHVIEERLDVSDYDAVTAAIARAKDADVPLRGVFHTAGIVDNLPVGSVTADTVANMFAPKVTGAVNLDRAVRDAGIDLDHFVLYSSIAGLLGGFPQISYSAANAALQELACSRRRRGQRTLCVDWGAMAGGGMAEANEETVKYLSLLGLRPIDMDVATDFLAECLRLDLPHVSIVDIDWSKAIATTHAVAHSPRFAEYASGAQAGANAAAALRAEILALPADQRGEVLTYVLAEELAVVMGVAAEAVDVETPLMDLGMDSLMAVEFAARAGKRLGIQLSAMELGRGVGLSGIGVKLAAELEKSDGGKAA